MSRPPLGTARALIFCAGAACLQACAVAEGPSRIEWARLGFGLNTEGRVSPGCVAKSFGPRDPIHLSMRISAAPGGDVMRVAVRDVLTNRVAWREDRPVPAGVSVATFEIGRELALGRYRADATLGGWATPPQEFVVRNRPVVVP